MVTILQSTLASTFLSISLTYIASKIIDNKPAMIKVMAWRPLTDDGPLLDPMMTILLTHINATYSLKMTYLPRVFTGGSVLNTVILVLCIQKILYYSLAYFITYRFYSIVCFVYCIFASISNFNHQRFTWDLSGTVANCVSLRLTLILLGFSYIAANVIIRKQIYVSVPINICLRNGSAFGSFSRHDRLISYKSISGVKVV